MASKTRTKQETKKEYQNPAFETIGKQANTPHAVFSDQNEIDATETTETSAPESPYKIYLNNIYSYIDEFIESEYAGLTDNELKENRAFFPALIQYLYNNYIGDVLKNKTVYKSNKIKPNYRISNIDLLFDIYTNLVYKYKYNNRPLIIEFSLFTGINRDYFYDWRNGLNNNYLDVDGDNISTNDISDTVAKWISVCERALIDGNDTIKDIFILKAKHGYRDNNNDVTITVNHKAVVSADVLPDLIGINGKN